MLKENEINVGDSHSAVLVDDLKRTQIVQYAGASGDYNPLHNHCEYIKGSNYDLSCVGYLSLPDSMIPTQNSKSHNDYSAQIQFVEGSENKFSDSQLRIDPKVRDWYLFPNYLMHSVYSFNSEDENAERVSFSFNATINFE